MSKFIGIAAAVLGLIGLCIVALHFIMFFTADLSGGAGMGLLFLQAWGAIFSMAGIALGIIAVMLAKGVDGAARKGGRMGLACGLLGVVTLFAGMQFL